MNAEGVHAERAVGHRPLACPLHGGDAGRDEIRVVGKRGRRQTRGEKQRRGNRPETEDLDGHASHPLAEESSKHHRNRTRANATHVER
jgi:hypothetical protein